MNSHQLFSHEVNGGAASGGGGGSESTSACKEVYDDTSMQSSTTTTANESASTSTASSAAASSSGGGGGGGHQRRKRYVDDVSIMESASLKLAEHLSCIHNALRAMQEIVDNGRKDGKLRVKRLEHAIATSLKYVQEALNNGNTLFQAQKTFQEQVGQAYLATLQGRCLSERSDIVPIEPINRAHEIMTHVYPTATRGGAGNGGNLWSRADEFADLLAGEHLPAVESPPPHLINSASAWFGATVSRKTAAAASLPVYVNYRSDWLCASVIPDDDRSDDTTTTTTTTNTNAHDNSLSEIKTMLLGANGDSGTSGSGGGRTLSSKRDAADGIAVQELSPSLQDSMKKYEPTINATTSNTATTNRRRHGT